MCIYASHIAAQARCRERILDLARMLLRTAFQGEMGVAQAMLLEMVMTDAASGSRCMSALTDRARLDIG